MRDYVAIVEDIRKDRRTKNVLAQTNTKTVSAPPASTGLTGDQLPAEVFTVADFDLVRNQVHLEEKNFQLLEALNTMGQISNMQSQSGPIPGTMTVEDVSVSSSATWTTLFTGKPGEVYECYQIGIGSIVNRSGNLTVYVRAYDVPNDKAVVIDFTTITGSADTNLGDLDTPLYVDQNIRIDVYVSGTFDSVLAKVLVARVR